MEIAHVLFMDIVGYSKLPMEEQQRVLRRLQHAVRDTPEFARAQDTDQLIRLPTGDGMALVFFGDPEAPARCALELSLALRALPDIKLRMGIHSGPVYRLADINANRNVSGGGINLAQRVMDCGDAGHILVSASVAEVLHEIGNWGHALHDIGEAEVKHGVRVHVFNLCTRDGGNPNVPQRLASRVSGSQSSRPGVPANAALDSLIGMIVSHYQVLRRLDGGGMGIVYEAVDTRLGRHVALKFLSEHLLQDAMALERFRREATLASSLNHPNICTLYDIGEHAGRNFLVLELLSGRTLQARMELGNLELHDVLSWSLQIADALQMAHSRGIVHRDIKPGNIFITDVGSAKILDFGLAKLSDAQSAVQPAGTAAVKLTIAGMPLGTVAYMSPEQARGEDLDARSDIFSFGAVLYEMTTGRVPFEGNTSAVVFDAILNRAPIAPITLNRNLPPALGQIINRAIEKDRAHRYHSAGELAADLRRLVQSLESRAGSGTSARSAMDWRPTRRPLLYLSSVCAAVALVIVVIWFVRPRSHQAPSIPSTQQHAPAGVSIAAQAPPQSVAPGKNVNETKPKASPVTNQTEAKRPTSAAVSKQTAAPDAAPASATSIGMSGEYAGVLRVSASGLSASASARLLEQAGVVSGCLSLLPPLRGSGAFQGISQGGLVLITVYFPTGRTELQGQLVGEELRGKFIISEQGRRQEGTFALQRKTSPNLHAVADVSNCPTE